VAAWIPGRIFSLIKKKKKLASASRFLEPVVPVVPVAPVVPGIPFSDTCVTSRRRCARP